MTEPEYHKQPHTQDPTKEPPEDDAPLAQGHSRELADEVKEAIGEHKEAVDAAADAEAESGEVGPRAPGDHAGESDESDQPDAQTEPAETTYDPEAPEEEPPDGSIDDVLAWVGDDSDRASQALEAENARSTPRSSLVTKLESITGC